jgi:hypothetical protein
MPELTMLNSSPKYTKAHLIEPTKLGYIDIGAEVSPPTRPGPVLRLGSKNKQLLARMKELGGQLEQLDTVVKVTVFRAIAFMPATGYVKKHPELKAPSFDVRVLIETRSVDDIPAVRDSEPYKKMISELEAAAKRLHIVAAKNLKRTGDVDRAHQGTFVFNHLVGADADVAVENWEWMGGWYAVETGLDNSTLLVALPGEHSDFLAINNARWPYPLKRLAAKQMLSRSFWNYVVKNLDAHEVGAFPVFYNLA